MINQEQAEGKFDQLKGKIKQAWGDITDDDLTRLKGNRDEFLGIVKEKHGIALEEVNKRLKEMETSCSSQSDKAA